MREKPLILVVDDEQDLREIMSIKLNASGFDTAAAGSAVEAVDVAKKMHPDLILMDIHMPGVSGTDAALQIKQDPETKDIKIAFLSNLKDPWFQTSVPRNDLAKAIGMDDFIDKTEDLDITVTKVKEILSRTEVIKIPTAVERVGVLTLERNSGGYFYCFFGRIFFAFGSTFAARRDLNFSTRPAVSMSFSSPV